MDEKSRREVSNAINTIFRYGAEADAIHILTNRLELSLKEVGKSEAEARATICNLKNQQREKPCDCRAVREKCR